MPKRNSPQVFFTCPHCGHSVPAGAKLCRNCGATEDCGWNEDSDYDSEYEPDDDQDDDFDYDRFVAREFPDQAEGPLQTDHKPWVKAVVLTIILSFVLTLLAF